MNLLLGGAPPVDKVAEVDFLLVCSCVEGGSVRLPVYLLKCMFGPSRFVYDVFYQGRACVVSDDLLLEFVVAGDAIRFEVYLYGV